MSCWIYSPSTSLDSSGGLADLCLPRNQWSNHFWWKQCTNRTGWSTHSLLLALQQVWNLPSMLLQMCENILSPLNSLLFVWIHNCNPPHPIASHPEAFARSDYKSISVSYMAAVTTKHPQPKWLPCLCWQTALFFFNQLYYKVCFKFLMRIKKPKHFFPLNFQMTHHYSENILFIHFFLIIIYEEVSFVAKFQ